MILGTLLAMARPVELVTFPGCGEVRWDPVTRTVFCLGLELDGLDTTLLVRTWSQEDGLNPETDAFVNLDHREAFAALATFGWAPTLELFLQNERFQVMGDGAERRSEVPAVAEGPLGRSLPAHLEGGGCFGVHRMDSDVGEYEVVCPDETRRFPASGGACQLESGVFLLNHEGSLLQYGGAERLLADVPDLSLLFCVVAKEHWGAVGSGDVRSPSVQLVDLDTARWWSRRGGLGGRMDGVNGFFVRQRTRTVLYELRDSLRPRVLRTIRGSRGALVVGSWRDRDALCWAVRAMEDEVTRVLCDGPPGGRRSGAL